MPLCTGVFAVIAVGLLGTALQDKHAHDAALDLLARGRVVTVSDVEVQVVPGGRYGNTPFINKVRVALPLDGQVVDTLLITGSRAEDYDVKPGWRRPPESSMYASPLDVLTLPEDPSIAMAADEAAMYRTSSWAQLVVFGSGSAAAAVLSGVIWWRLSRARQPGRHRL